MNRLFEVDVKIIPEVEAKRFLKKLKSVGFLGKNKEYLYNYMNKNEVARNNFGVAFNHIKSNYIEFVINKGWSERKYADITFIITRNKELFSLDNYSKYGDDYDNRRLNDDILREREKYKRKSQI